MIFFQAQESERNEFNVDVFTVGVIVGICFTAICVVACSVLCFQANRRRERAPVIDLDMIPVVVEPERV